MPNDDKFDNNLTTPTTTTRTVVDESMNETTPDDATTTNGCSLLVPVRGVHNTTSSDKNTSVRTLHWHYSALRLSSRAAVAWMAEQAVARVTGTAYTQIWTKDPHGGAYRKARACHGA